MSRCTCETQGHCRPCRETEPPCHDSNRDYCDVCEPDQERRCIGCQDATTPCGQCKARPYGFNPSFGQYADHTYCHWCWTDITYYAQYIVGRNRDELMVCGPRCPCRPKQMPRWARLAKGYT